MELKIPAWCRAARGGYFLADAPPPPAKLGLDQLRPQDRAIALEIWRWAVFFGLRDRYRELCDLDPFEVKRMLLDAFISQYGFNPFTRRTTSGRAHSTRRTV